MPWRLLDAGLLLLGGGCVVIGVAQIFPPAAWIVAGAACIALGTLPTRRT